MPSVELLSPAGNWDSLKAAVDAGADAVYLGVGRFNARQRAENFSPEDLPRVTSFCHERGVKVHLAANTLVKNSELGDYFSLLACAYSAGVDAVIVQEISFIPLLKENFPGLSVHASTQAGVFNSFHKDILDGVERVILPRELTIAQIKEFHEKTGLPVEVFVQGALCFSISGQCLMSSFLGGRSGNRGLCAQPCRKKYNSSFSLSTKDLCVADRLGSLIDAGVSALKIEGRLRDPGYVAAATYLYRKMLDTGVVDPDAFLDMQLAFSRGYTCGLMFRESAVASPEAAGKRGALLGRLGDDKSIILKEQVRVGDGVGIISGNKAHGDYVRGIEYNGRFVNSGKVGQKVKLSINAKAGSEIVLTSGAERRKPYSFPKKEKIEVVRSAPAQLTLPRVEEAHLSETRLLAKVYCLKDAFLALEAGADRVYYNLFAKDYPTSDARVSPYVPRCLSEWNASAAIEMIKKMNSSSALVGDSGVASHLPGCEVYLDISGNVFNDCGVLFWANRNVTPIISPELSFRELQEFRDKRFAVYVHGRVPLMSSKYDLKEKRLKDDLGYIFPVRSELDCRQVLNSVPTSLCSEILKLRACGIVHYLLDLEENTTKTVSDYVRILSGEKVPRREEYYTFGHFKKGVE
jgi:collagenase-like PrtC family protease